MTILLSSVFLAGLLSFFTPCTYALMPAYIGILSDYRNNPLESLLKTFAFTSGLGVTFITLGFGAGIFGGLINSNAFYWISGSLIIAMGLHQMELIKIKSLEKFITPKFRTFEHFPIFSAFWIGLTFSFAWTPCVGPVLGSVLLVASDNGSALYGGFYMFIYTLGLALPFVVITLLSKYVLDKLPNLEKYLRTFKRIGGALIILMGLIIMTRQLNSLSIWLERIF